MGGGVSAYAAISARVRVKYSQLLTESELGSLGATADVASLTDGLRHTPYVSAIHSLTDHQYRVPAVIGALKRRQAEESWSVIQAAPGNSRRVLLQLHCRHEVNNLKAVLRGIAAAAPLDTEESSRERTRKLLFPLGQHTLVPAELMFDAGNVASAIELLRGTPYYEVLSFAMKRYSSEQSLFPLEVALDLDYWRRLWQEARKLSGEDQAQALRVVGSLVDANNLMWAIRYRVYQHLTEEELINYTLPFGHRVHDSDIRAIAGGANIGSILGRLFPEMGDGSIFLSEPRSGLPRLELTLKRMVAVRCMGAFLGNPFHVGLPLAFLILHDLEIQDLIVLLEAKSTGMPAEEFQPYLLRSAGVVA